MDVLEQVLFKIEMLHLLPNSLHVGQILYWSKLSLLLLLIFFFKSYSSLQKMLARRLGLFLVIPTGKHLVTEVYLHPVIISRLLNNFVSIHFSNKH